MKVNSTFVTPLHLTLTYVTIPKMKNILKILLYQILEKSYRILQKGVKRTAESWQSSLTFKCHELKL